MTERTSYDVRFWKTEKYAGKKVTTYRVRWLVAGRRFRRNFRTTAAAESFRAELMTAHRKGEAFDPDTGLPVTAARAESRSITWYEFACQYVDMKWPDASPKHRKGIAEALLTVTPVMLVERLSPEEAKVVRSALLNWAFNTRRRGTLEQPEDVTRMLAYVARASRPLSAISRPDLARKALSAMTLKLDGQRAAAATVSLKRAVLNNALLYAVELGLLNENPLARIQWKMPKLAQSIDCKVVVNPVQARALLRAVATVQRSGPRLVAFFGCIYFSALRPEEAVRLEREDLELPEGDGWGWINVGEAAPETDRQWTDTDTRREGRALKHRAVGAVRRAPMPPELVRLLKDHLRLHAAPRGPIFVGEKGALISGLVYRRVWARARLAAFGECSAAGVLARRPYDLRHAAVSTWLNSGVPAAQVSAWAGHSVDVLLRVYASCVDDDAERALRRIEAELDARLGP